MLDGYITVIAVEPAPAPKRDEKPFLSVQFWVAVGSLIAVLLIGAVVLNFMDRWRKRQMLASQDPAESLTSFRTLYEQGELSEEEYQRVRDRVAAKMKDTTSVPSVQTDTPMETPRVKSDEPAPPQDQKPES